MPKKNWTEEERKAFGQKMRAAKLAKETHSTMNPAQASITPEPPANEPVDPGNMHSSEMDELRRMVMELQAAQWQQRQPVGPQAGQAGLVGTYEKYRLEPNYYPDPRERLAKEPRLQRFAFDMNYELDWKVSVSSYKTIDGINTKEPKFTLELNRVMVDEDTGEPTDGRYTVCRAIFHEDPEAAIVVARENGLEVGENERDFLDEMRYLRMRDWLFEAFYPPKAAQEKTNKREMVINGKLVEYFEINSETAEAVPFGQLKTKL